MIGLKKLLTSLALPIAATAQIVASCNPVSSTTCGADKALATSFVEDFSQESDYFEAVVYSDRISYNESDGVSLTLAERYDNPSLKSKFYIMFGKVEVVLKAAPGRGIVSSFYLQSDDLDEIDLEWIGSDTTEVQTNYFSKGNTSTYDRGAFHGVYEPQNEYHNYTIDWTKDSLTWYLDGAELRTVPSDSASGYPQSPMYLVMGIWAGGDPSNAAGTIEWAGGETDYSEAPFTMYVQKVIVTDYSTGTEYSYGDQSGSWESIKATGGEVNGRYEQAQEDFAILAAGGDIDTDWDSGNSTSSSESSKTSQSTSSSQEASTSSKIHDGLASSRSRAGTVYSSGASSLVTRSESGRTQTVLSSSLLSSSDDIPSSTLSTSTKDSATKTTTDAADDGSLENAQQSVTKSSTSSSSTVVVSNDGIPMVISIGENGMRALFVSFGLTIGLLFML